MLQQRPNQGYSFLLDFLKLDVTHQIVLYVSTVIQVWVPGCLLVPQFLRLDHTFPNPRQFAPHLSSWSSPHSSPRLFYMGFFFQNHISNPTPSKDCSVYLHSCIPVPIIVSPGLCLCQIHASLLVWFGLLIFCRNNFVRRFSIWIVWKKLFSMVTITKRQCEIFWGFPFYE